MAPTDTKLRALGEKALPFKISDAELVVFDGLPDAFWSVMLAPESDDAFKRMSSFLVRHTGRGTPSGETARAS